MLNEGPVYNKSSSNASVFNLFVEIIEAGQQVNRRLLRAGDDIVHKISASLFADPSLTSPPLLTILLLPLQKVQLQAIDQFAYMDAAALSATHG